MEILDTESEGVSLAMSRSQLLRQSLIEFLLKKSLLKILLKGSTPAT